MARRRAPFARHGEGSLWYRLAVDLDTLTRWDSLRGVRVARRVLERAHGVTLAVVDTEGLLAHQRAGVLSTPVAACRALLFHKEGFAACDAHYRDLGRGAGDRPCHAGLQTEVFPVAVDGEVLAHLVASGWAPSAEEPDRAELVGRLRRAAPNDDGADAARRLPVLDRGALASVRAAAETAAAEIVAHEEDRRARAAAPESPGLWGMVGRSPVMHSVFELLPKLAQSDATALLLGESGTGKEIAARALHEHGPRASGPFVAQSCGATTDELLESLLFGHVRGAFSGADRPSTGLFGAADGGTLFLDEVGEMSAAMQAKLLRVLQDRKYTPVGATAPRAADVRVVTATHRDLRAMVDAGDFREDLYFRLHVLVLRLPPLRERTGDLPLLVEAFLAEVQGAPGKVGAAALECIERYDWPGNVRELRSEVERWAITAGDSLMVEPRHLSPAVREAGGYALAGAVSTPEARAAAQGTGTLAEAIASLERAIIDRGLERTEGNRTQLAKELDISRTTLADRLKRYGLE